MERTKRITLTRTMFITLLTILSIAGFTLYLDNQCQRAFDNNRPIYPSADLLSSESIFMNLRREVYQTQDSMADVQNWYNRTHGIALREAVAETGTSGAVWAGEWKVEQSEDGGTIITLEERCS